MINGDKNELRYIQPRGKIGLKKNKVKGRKKQFKKERLKVSFTTELYCLLKTCCRLNWIWWIAGCNYKPKEVEDDRCGSRPKPAKIRDDEFQLSILKKRNDQKRSEGGRRPTERSVFSFHSGLRSSIKFKK